MEGQDRAGLRKKAPAPSGLSVSSRRALVAPGSHPQKATIRKQMFVTLYSSTLKTPRKEVSCFNLDLVPIS